MAEVRAEMAADVWRVAVAGGDRVEEGDTLVILESTKMEIRVPAEGRGTISRPAVKEGAVVRRGDLIAVLDTP
ncbi:biotin/lipoyl-binding carrier protein [Spirillospora sp. CA-255316]